MPGAISQDLSTTSGTTYKVDFAMAGNPAGSPVTKTMEVSAAGFSETFTFDTTGKTLADIGWEPRTFYFVATGSTTTLEFKSLDPNVGPLPAFGPAIDDVSADAPKKIDVCHKGKKTINISNHAVPAHIAHGDTLGPCA